MSFSYEIKSPLVISTFSPVDLIALIFTFLGAHAQYGLVPPKIAIDEKLAGVLNL